MNQTVATILTSLRDKRRRHFLRFAPLFVLILLSVSGCARHRPPVTLNTNPAPQQQRVAAQNKPCIWPLPGNQRAVSSRFGEIRNKLGGKSRKHGGIDITAPKGWPIVATADGKVACADKDPNGYGLYVMIDHLNGYMTLYGHMSDIDAKPGKNIKRGDKIGEVGATGNATGNHVHYEVRQNGARIDPAPFLGP